MRRAPWLVLLGVSSYACTEPSSAMIAPPAEGIAFVAIFDAELTRPLRTDGPFDLAAESLRLSFDPPERPVLLVFDPDRIHDTRVTADLDDRSRMTLAFEMLEDQCERGERLTDGRLRFALDRFGEAYEFVEDQFTALSSANFPPWHEASLNLAESREACVATRSFSAFGAIPQLFAGDVTIGDERFSRSNDPVRYERATQLEALESVGPDTVIAISTSFLFLFNRGEDFSNDPQHVLAVRDLYRPDYDFAQFSSLIEFRERGQTRYAVLSSAGLEPHQSRVDVISAGAAGLQLVPTSSFAGTYEYLLTDGQSIFMVDNGKGAPAEPIRLATSLDGPFEPVGLLGFEPESRPDVASGQRIFAVDQKDQRVFCFDAARGSTEPLANQPKTVAGGYDSRGLSFDPTESALWLVADALGQVSGHPLLRYDLATEVWTEPSVELGPEAIGCGTRLDPCGDIATSSYLRKVQRSALGRVSLVKDCPLLLMLDPTTGCEAAALQEGGRPLEPDPVNKWLAVEFDDARVLVAGTSGYLVELDMSTP